MSSLIKQKETG